jgi:hypothetical protein
VKSIKWLFLCVCIVSLLSGCVANHKPSKIIELQNEASDFFGIICDDVDSFRASYITSYSIYNGVRYNSISLENRKILAYAKLSNGRISLDVINRSQYPISTNYFGDSFVLITKDLATYVLDKGNILDYPDVNYINPNTSVRFRFSIPQGIFKENIFKIVCDLFGVNNPIVLVPLPEAIEITTERRINAEISTNSTECLELDDLPCFDQSEGELYSKVLKVPAANFEENMYYYYLLMKRSPDNKKYREKFFYYYKKFLKSESIMKMEHYIVLDRNDNNPLLETADMNNARTLDMIPRGTVLKVRNYIISRGIISECVYFYVSYGDKSGWIADCLTDRWFTD